MVTRVIMPQFGETMEEGSIVRWLSKEGDLVEKGQPLVEVTTDKVNMEIESPESGVLLRINANPDQVVPVMQVIAYIGNPGEQIEDVAAVGLKSELPKTAAASRTFTKEPEKKSVAAPRGDELIVASPIARRVAKELGIDLAFIKGSGPRGRIIEADVRAAAQKDRVPVTGMTDTKANVKTIPMTNRHRIMAERMSMSVRQAPHIVLTIEVDMSSAEKRRGIASYTALIAHRVARLLKQHSLLNARLQAQEIVLIPDVNLGIAVDTPEGLIVPVIKNADQKSLTAVDEELNQLAQRARDGKLTLRDIEAGTFTISNLGGFGIMEFHAIINPPESAILAIGAIVMRPVAVGDLIGLRPMMNLTLSADHRVLDGATAARFLRDLRSVLEE